MVGVKWAVLRDTMGVVFNCRKESASQKSMKSNNGQLSKNKVVGILFPQTSLLFLDSGAAPRWLYTLAMPPSPCLPRPASLTLFNLSVVSSAAGVGEICQQLWQKLPRGWGGGVSGALTTASVSGQGGQAWGQCVSWGVWVKHLESALVLSVNTFSPRCLGRLVVFTSA